MNDIDFKFHYSVLKKEILDSLEENKKDSLVFADLTFGAGGHSFSFLQKFNNSKVFAVDQDVEAYTNGLNNIEKLNVSSRIHLKNTNYENFYDWIQADYPEQKFDGILLDLGVSSHQFDSPERGFSFREDGPLDMRMNTNENQETAADVLNTYKEEDIANIIYLYGEERLSRRIAKSIVEFRQKTKFSRTKELENICFHAYPANARHKGSHPATRTFQALRIYVNRELEVLEKTLPKLYDLLNEDGKIFVISFHSLEDRITKNIFKNIYQNDIEKVKIITKKPITPSEREIGENIRSRSAKLRILMKTKEGENGKKKYKSRKIE